MQRSSVRWARHPTGFVSRSDVEVIVGGLGKGREEDTEYEPDGKSGCVAPSRKLHGATTTVRARGGDTLASRSLSSGDRGAERGSTEHRVSRWRRNSSLGKSRLGKWIGWSRAIAFTAR